MGNAALLLAAVLLIGFGAFGVWVRLATVDAGRWHVDPRRAEAPGQGGWLVRDDADAAPPRLDGTAGEVLGRLDAIATAEPRTRRIAGSVGEGRITYESRSRVWGFPDYTTVAVETDAGRVAPVLLGRARFGRSDLGVNRARIERWLSELQGGAEPG
jgi:uncharacterized protein (DUF1499 family)